MRTIGLTAIALSVISLVGCGPMKNGPIPPTLDAEQQQKIDEAWERALTPIDHLDKQAFLDALVLSQGFQTGVDKLTLRSEKRFSGGIVIMEIHMDRAKPVEDRFVVTIRDKTGEKVLRQMEYGRDEVERTVRELENRRYTCASDPNDAKAPVLDVWEIKKREEVQQRLKAVEAIFPKEEELSPK